MKQRSRTVTFVVFAGLVAAGLGGVHMVDASEKDARSTYFTSDVVKIAGDFQFTEGPVWHRDGYLLFSDIPANKIYKSDGDSSKEVWRADSGNSNGLTFDREGRLVACEHGNRRVSRTEKDGSITVIADTYEGKKLNSPNDCVVRSDGMIFFTDPPYGLAGRPKELDFHGVYRIMPGSQPVLLADDFDRPNGLAFSPDEKKLYIADTTGAHVRVFDVASDGTVSGGNVLADVDGPDGLKVDTKGNLYVTATDGIAVIDPSGKRVYTLECPERPANNAIGGADSLTLYITARSGFYKVRMVIPGVSVW